MAQLNGDQPTLDQDEKRVIDAFRRVKVMKYGDVTAKVHRGKLTALSVTDKWCQPESRMREIEQGGAK